MTQLTLPELDRRPRRRAEKPLSERAREHAAALLGVTPHATAEEIGAAISSLTDNLPERIRELDGGTSTGDPLLDRKLRAAHLLLTPAGDIRTRARRVLMFVTADSKVEPGRQAFPAAPQTRPDGQLLMALA